MTDKFLRVGQVAEIVGMSRTTIWRKEESGEFPRGVVIHGRSKRWSENEVDEWMDERKSERKPALSFLGGRPRISSDVSAAPESESANDKQSTAQ